LLNILTVDFEEWYHPEYVRDRCPENKESCAAQDLQATFSLLEKHRKEATFFIIGEIAQRNPSLIEQIRSRGHEVGFHGFDHEPLLKKDAETLKLEIARFRALVGDVCVGYRAPSFSLNNKTNWALNVLEENGFRYDSSVFPASTPLYGVRNAPIKPYRPNSEDVSAENGESALWEFPLHVYSTPLLRVPMAGGFYLRFFPLRLIRKSIKKANEARRPAVMFIHTWELNPTTPKLKLRPYRSFVTYHNLEKTASRLDQILSQFEFTSIRNYMKEQGLQ
jgi:polysaccharide deacetylase family protein (PEP-CTERM system associated)